MILNRKIFSNSLWMMLEKFVGIFGLIFVNSYMAKYLGPENFGKLVYVISLFTFVQTIAWFGAQNVLFKRLSQNLESGVKLALATQIMRVSLYFIVSILLLTYLYIFTDMLTFIFGVGNFIAMYFIVRDIYSIHNNSQLISKINALTNIFGLILALLTRYFLVYFEAPVYSMIYPIIILALFPYVIRLYVFKKMYVKDIKIFKNEIKKYNKYLFVTGGSLVLSTISITIYSQISNMFLVKYASFSDLGIYNIAVTLGSAWSFISLTLITSYFSKIYAVKNISTEYSYLSQIHWIVILVSIFMIIVLYLIGKWVIQTLYGQNFIQATEILLYIAVATMFSGLGTISYRYMIKMNGYKYLSIKMMIVSIISIPVSMFLIKYYGIYGAAYTLIIIEFLSLTLANYFFSRGKIMKLHFSVLLSPFLNKIK